MKLTSLEINGFKSFADKTKLRFDQGITGIVGPNGCGKSNVIDAIRWVLGEQKTRNLRSDKMEDVIFNGTDKRKRANVSDVSITFENTKNVLPTEYPSITITRRLYRDGESEYYLNSVPCRLKDINALLLDTGIGSDSYSIIELGMVEALLKDKNGSRRQLFEEAAGISRYKVRKKETLDRLNETDGSLVRLEDVLFEIEKNLKTLERQAKKAEQYFALKEEYKTTSAQVAFLKSEEINATLVTAQSLDQDLQEQLTGVAARVAKHEARIAEKNKDLTDGEQVLAAEQRDLNQINENIRKQEGEKQVRAERVKYLEKRATDVQKQIEQGREKITELETKLATLESQIDNENEAYDKQEFLLGEIETELDELKQSVRNRQLQTEELATQVRSKEKGLQNVLRETEHREVEIRSLKNELQRYEKDRETRQSEAGHFSEKIAPLQEEISGIKNRIAELEQQKTDTENQINTTKERINALNETVGQVRRNLDAKQNEFKLTKNLVDSLEGYPDSVIYLKKNVERMKDVPLVSDLISCEAQYKVAIENYLESYMNYYVVETRADAVDAIQVLAKAGKGRVNFIILDELNAYAETLRTTPRAYPPLTMEGVIPVLNLVNSPEKYRSLVEVLFANTYLWTNENFPDIELPNGEALLHQTGSYISKKFALGGGSVGVFEGKRLGRAQNLAQLGKEVEELKKALTEAETANAQEKQTLEQLRLSLPTLDLDQLNKQIIRKNQELTALQARGDEFQRSLQQIDARSAELTQKIQRLEGEAARFRPQVEQAQDELHTLQDNYAKEQKEYQSRTEHLNKLNQRFNQENLTFVNIKNNISNLKKDFRSFLEQIQNIRSAEENLTLEIERNATDLEFLRQTDNSDEDLIIQLYQQKQSQGEKVRFAEDRVSGIKESVKQNENFIREERKKRDDLQTERNDLYQKTTELRVQRNAIADRLSVEWGLELDALKAEDYFGEKKPAEFSLPDLEKKMLNLREKYNKFGEVNTAAVESYQEVKKRYDFMIAQKEDLLTAKNNLLQTIAEIDGTATELFMNAYNQIREHFQRVFRTLFTEDDTCDIVLVNPDDPLESPIDIIAKPKGKRPQTISALSGGEKTLTAISLLFSIYLIKPAPFCIFDEVDAPLDDANIDKFNNIIEEFSKDSQFIIVTHNKRTMVRTQIMYGVTMEEKGVSRVLPVDLVNLNLG